MATKTKQIVSTTVMRIGKSILTREHNFFIASGLDDTEHIPKVKRIIDSIEDELIELGLTSLEAGSLSGDLREFAKSLFMECWMENIDEFEEQNEVWAEGSQEFDSIYFYHQT